jgi:hypothetical protein
MPAPLYTADNCRSAYQLNWSVSIFWRTSPPRDCQWLDSLKAATEADGVRILEHRLKNVDVSQFLVSTRPDSAPPQIVRSLKGRLQYLLREPLPKAFQRNYSIHSVGSANLAAVEAYVASQLEHHRMADQRVQLRLAKHQIHWRISLQSACRAGA